MKSLFKRVVVAILCFEAKILLLRKKPKIIAVTGSVGKTSTKDAIFAILKDHVHTRKSQKSFNSEIGVPLSVLALENGWNNPFLWIKNIFDGAIVALFARQYPEVLVLEMGVDRPGDMKKLTAWIKPDVVVLTRFPDVPVHVEFFTTPEAVVEEKMTLVHALKEDGVVVYNHDDAIIKKALEPITKKTIGYSLHNPSQFVAKDQEVHYVDAKPAGITCLLTHIEEEVALTLHGVLGVPQLYMAACAIAVGVQFGVSMQAATAALSNLTPTPGRMRLIPGKNDSTILDDTYNASPVAVEQALVTLDSLHCDGRKIAILGDMLELGQFSVREHERVGNQVVGVVDILITVGLRSEKTAQTAIKNGFSSKKVFEYEDVEKALPHFDAFTKPGDIVLVKGSQGIRAEKIVKALMQKPDQASELLVRQSKMWDRR